MLFPKSLELWESLDCVRSSSVGAFGIQLYRALPMQHGLGGKQHVV